MGANGYNQKVVFSGSKDSSTAGNRLEIMIEFLNSRKYAISSEKKKIKRNRQMVGEVIRKYFI